MIIALAGRRIDALDAQTPHFPLKNTAKVQECISALFVEHEATALVCSAACGADLLALEAAGELGLRCRIVLPFDCDRFSKSSVTDRPGDWGDLFDRVSREVEAVGDLVVLHNLVEEEDAYAAVNKAILEEAIALARQDDGNDSHAKNNSSSLEERVLAVIVWDGAKPVKKQDLTAMFAQAARERGLRIAEIPTLY
jgi:cytosine/adenosine deaminase-related metal-dependent hydrolase